MSEDRLNTYGWLVLWLTLLVAALICRPPMPIDETRYLSVAWEMWQKHQFLVPQSNGLPYSHKPPLLFWLIQVGWWFFGVNPWSARLTSPLFGLFAVLLAVRLTRMLWPERIELHKNIPQLIVRTTTALVALLIFLHLGLDRPLHSLYDVTAISRRIENTQKEGQLVAVFPANLSDQFQFAGRLTARLVPQPTFAKARFWSQQHPDAQLLLFTDPRKYPSLFQKGTVLPFKNASLIFCSTKDVNAVYNGSEKRIFADSGRGKKVAAVLVP